MPKRDQASADHFREWIHSARGIIKIKMGDKPLVEWWSEPKAETKKAEARKLQRPAPVTRRKRA